MAGFDTKILGDDRESCEEKYHIHFYTNNTKQYKIVEEVCRLCIDSHTEKHAHWIDRNGACVYPEWERYKCSNCGHTDSKNEFCSLCGARMDKEDD